MSALKKQELRKQAIEHRDKMDPFSEDPDEAIELFFETIAPDENRIVAVYWPMGKEFDTSLLIEQLFKKNCICVLPIVDGASKVLRFAKWNANDKLEKGPYSVMQPVQNKATEWMTPETVVVPMLAFDRHGYRLGYGGGYYDATLKDLRDNGEIVAVGLAYSCQAVLFNLPVEDHDQKLDWIITPQKIQRY